MVNKYNNQRTENIYYKSMHIWVERESNGYDAKIIKRLNWFYLTMKL